MNARILLLALFPAIACGPSRPEVLTPVRPDTVSRMDTITLDVIRPDGVPTRAYQTVADDPFTRIDRMGMPGPNQYRSANGAPGPEYWQQEADYTISATLDTAARRLSGSVRIAYTNNSPDSLSFLWLQLDQNLYRPGSRGASINPADSRWGARNFQGGYEITGLTAGGETAESNVDDTMMRIDLDSPLPPNGGETVIAMDFAFLIPDHGSDRFGRDSTLYELAQWYPRMAVFDDVRGWNTEPYLGQGEFYLEYGNFEFAITVPAGYVIAASGTLQNPNDVLTAAQRSRLAAARTADTVVQIITAGESVPEAEAGTETWRFSAENVRDVAWAAAPDFRWDATSWNGILTQAYYPWPRAGAGWENGAENTQWSIRTYSELLFPYPYPQATSVAGPVGGMEYPMFVMVHYADEPQGAFGTIDHEHAHEWFPMIVGSNERRYAWMDEGFNTYVNAFSDERRVPGSTAWTSIIDNWRGVAEAGIQEPLMTPPDRIDRAALGAIGYRKPAAVLLTLRNHVVGAEAMDLAFREYVERWAFKHPTPADFMRTVENVTGEDLSWFWRAFLYSDDVLDIGIEGVTMREAEGERFAVVSLARHTSIPFPVTLRLAFTDGSTRDVTLPVEIWALGDRYQAEIAVDQTVTGVRLWPDPSVPDWDSGNNTWGDAPAADELGAVTGGGLASSIGGR
ncbi:MAG: M1 family metallopeptidase [Gemmatimonadaceae bacterium]